MQIQKAKNGYKLSQFLFHKFEEIPHEWSIVKLIELCNEKPRYGAAEAALPRDKSLPRYIRITDIKDDGTLNEGAVSILERDAKPFLLSKGDFLFARTGATVGKTYLYDEKDGQCAFAGYLIKFKPNEQMLNPEFLFHYCHSANYWKWLKSFFTHGVQPNVNAEQYSELLILKPTIREQQKIASILSKVDDLIQKTEEIIEQTRRLKKGLMQRLLIKGIGHTKFKETKIGRIPESWEVTMIGKECRVGTGGTPSRSRPDFFNGDIPWVKTTELRYNVIMDTEECITKEALENSSAKIYPKGTFILAMVGLEAVGTRGKCAILGVDAAVNQACAAIQPLNRLHARFLFYYYQTQRDKIMSLAGGTKRQNLNLELVGSITIPLPSISEQKKIMDILSRVDTLIETENARRSLLIELKKGLMQKLLTGQIRVKT